MKIMKTTNNTVINSIMRTYLKYICAVLLVIGTSAHAWATSCTLKIWDKSSGAYRDWLVIDESYTFTDLCDYPNEGSNYYCVKAWAPSEYGSSSYPSSSTFYYQTETYGTRGTPSVLYAVYQDPSADPYLYTSKPNSFQVDFNDCTSRTLTFANAEVNKTYGNSAGKYQSYTLSAGSGTETWESSNTSVATVNNSGTVTIVGAGSTTITAKKAASGDYCAVQGSYTLNVAAVAPTVNNTHLTQGTKTSTSITYSGGQVSNKGGAAITRYGYVLGTSSSVDYSTATKKTYTNSDVNLSTDFASKTISGLTPNTTYYIRPFAYNGTAYGYGTAVSFSTLQRYTITYNNNGGEGTISDQYKDYNVTATLNAGTAFSKTGYTLSRWDSNSSGTGNSFDLSGSYTTNSNLTCYAVWTADGYTITLNNQSATSGGTANISVTYNANTNLSGTPAITVPTRTGYTFGGYFTSTGGEGTQIIAANGNVIASVDGFTDASKNWIYANDITLYAYWTANTINLTLSRNGVTGTDGSASVDYDATSLTSISDATNSDANYHLVGYYAEAGTTTKVLESNGAFAASSVTGYITDGKWSCTTSPTTLYAKWATTIYTITFNMHGHGEAIDAQDVESGSKVATPAEPEVGDAIDGWRFLGWFTDDGAGSATNTNFDFAKTTITANTTIHAKWEEITYSTAYKAWCEPDISIIGDIHLTSVNGIAVYATSTTSNLLRIQSNDLAGVNKLEIKYLDADNEDAEVAKGSSPFRLCNDGTENYNVADGSQIDVSASNTYDQTFSISYTPTDYDVTNHYKLQITMKHGTNVLKTVTKDLYGRSLPEEFVVASKFGGEWYALPNTLEATEAAARAVAGIRITVDNTTTPTKATYAPSSTIYQGEGRYAANSNRYGIRLTDGTNHLQVSTTNNVNKMWLSSTGSANCQDWWLHCTDFTSYYTVTIPSNTGNESKKIGMDGGNIGYYASPTSPSEKIYFLPIEHTLVDNPASVTEWGQKSVILDVDAQGIAGAQARIGNGAAETAASFGMTRTSVKNSDSKYNYTVSFTTTDFSEHKGELLYIDWLDGESEVVSTSAVTIPWIIATNSVMGEIDNVQSHWKDWEVHVLPGKTLEADGNSFSAASNTAKIKTLEIYPGATVKVTSGTLNVTNLVIRNGWTRANGKSYEVARLYIASTANLTHSNVYADWYIDFDQYYPIAVPWNVTVANMSYVNTTGAVSVGPGNSNTVRLRYYDGNSRATNVQLGVGEGANWKAYGADGCAAVPATLNPSHGYAMTAKRPTGKAFSIIRMPLTIPSASWTASGEKGNVSTTYKDTVKVTSYNSGSTPAYAQGWNFIANPYMALHEGELAYNDESGDVIEYANIPDINFKEYDQVPIETTKLKPSSGFLVQAPKTGFVTFDATNRKASAPSYRQAPQTEKVSKQKAYIVLSNEEANDMMGLLISDSYTAEYEVNADLEKILSDGNTLRTYMRYNDMNMAYVAINSVLAEEWIPVSVRFPEAGEYTFSLHEASKVDELEYIYLIDYNSGDLITNLLDQSYTFYSSKGTIDNRFAINVKVGRHNTPTDTDIINAGGDINSSKPLKFLWNDKVFILHNGVIYDSTGKKVREINK